MQLLRSITGDDPAALRDRALLSLGMALAAVKISGQNGQGADK
jgi:hypothetical protein